MKKWYKKGGSIFIQDPKLKLAMQRLERQGKIVVDGDTAQQIGKIFSNLGKRDLIFIGFDRRSNNTGVFFKSPYVKVKLTDTRLDIFPKVDRKRGIF